MRNKQEVIDLIKEKIDDIKTEVDYDIYQYSDYDYQLTGQIDAYEDALELIESLTLSVEETELEYPKNEKGCIGNVCKYCKDKGFIYPDYLYCPYCGRKIKK